MDSPNYEDYLWTAAGGTAGEFQSFCLTLVEDSRVDEVITQLPVVEELRPLNFSDELRFRSYDDWNPQQLLVGLLQICSWTALFEVNGFLGDVPKIMGPLSKGRRVISHHFSDGNGSGSFSIYENGALTANFRPSVGIADLQADDPSCLIRLMQESGFDQPPNGHTLDRRQHNRAAAFALMERLTGVRLEPTTIADASFTVVRVQIRR